MQAVDRITYYRFIVFRPGVPRSPLPRPTAASCGEQVQMCGVHYATLVEDEDSPKSWEGTFLTEQTRQGTKIVTS
jgi:hypothetical protein